jgi:hypothetical protein
MKFWVGGSNSSLETGPLMANKVLNQKECGIVAVGTFGGKLVYRERNRGLATSQGIHHTLILQSKQHKELRYARSVEADFDIYLTDGRVIEVHSFDRATIQAAVTLAPTKDVRARFRAQRGV